MDGKSLIRRLDIWMRMKCKINQTFNSTFSFSFSYFSMVCRLNCVYFDYSVESNSIWLKDLVLCFSSNTTNENQLNRKCNIYHVQSSNKYTLFSLQKAEQKMKKLFTLKLDVVVWCSLFSYQIATITCHIYGFRLCLLFSWSSKLIFLVCFHFVAVVCYYMQPINLLSLLLYIHAQSRFCFIYYNNNR